MMKKLFYIVFLTLIIGMLTACGSSDESHDQGADSTNEISRPVLGGWEMYENQETILPAEVQEAFDQAVETYTGSQLKPVAYIAEQVVAGKNYMILCQSTPSVEHPVTTYQMIIVYADLEGKSEISTIKDFDLSAYTEGEGEDQSAGNSDGGWAVPEENSSTKLPDEAKKVFDQALQEFTGNNLEPLALLGTQIVAGTNYAFICTSSLTIQEPVKGIQIVTIYEDLDGNAEISNICNLNPADFN